MKRLLFLLPVFLAFQVSASPALAWTWPAGGPVLRYFQFGNDPYASGQHRGIDIQAQDGSDVLSPASGLVTFGGTVPSGGKTLTILTPAGYAVTLLHLGALSARKGENVVEGSVVGTAGRSGAPEHDVVYVHLGIRHSADRHGYLDPLSFLPARTSEASPVSVTHESAEGSRESLVGGDESQGHEGAAAPREGSSFAEPISAGTSSLGAAEGGEVPSPGSPVPAEAGAISAKESTENEAKPFTSEAVPEAQQQRADSAGVGQVREASLPDSSPADVPLDLFTDPSRLIGTAPKEAAAASGSDEANPRRIEVPSIDVSKTPEPMTEPSLAAAESQATGALEDTMTEAEVSVYPGNSSEAVPVLVHAAEAQGSSVNPASEADSPVTDGSDVAVPSEIAEEPGAAPSSSAGERPAATTRVNSRSDVGKEDRRRIDRAQSTAKPADSSTSTLRGKRFASDRDRPEHLGHVAASIAPAIQTIHPMPSASLWLGIPDDVERVPSVDSVPPEPFSGNAVPASRSRASAHDAVEVAPVTGSQPQTLVLLTLALVLGLSCAAAVAIRHRRRGGSGRTSPVVEPQPRPVAPARHFEPRLPELSESDRIALDAELDQILLSPQPTRRTHSKSGEVVRA